MNHSTHNSNLAAYTVQRTCVRSASPSLYLCRQLTDKTGLFQVCRLPLSKPGEHIRWYSETDFSVYPLKRVHWLYIAVTKLESLYFFQTINGNKEYIRFSLSYYSDRPECSCRVPCTSLLSLCQMCTREVREVQEPSDLRPCKGQYIEFQEQ